MNFYLFCFDSGLYIVVVMEGGATESIGLQVLHDEGAKSVDDLAPGEFNVYLTQGRHFGFVVC